MPVDIALAAVPQWSPFQPPLSLPSLAAWLRRAGFSCAVEDENIRFYDYLVSGEAAAILLADPAVATSGDPAMEAARDGLRSWRDFRADLDALLAWHGRTLEELTADRARVLRETYRAVNSLDAYLRFVSDLSADFEITPYEFRMKRGALDRPRIEHFVENCPPVLAAFVEQAAERLLARSPRMVGLSCIGQEQLLFTLLFGKAIKARADVPVIVGGTVFSRIFERGALPLDWMSRYIDVIVRNEGEKPLESLLSLDRFSKPDLAGISGLVYADGGELHSTAPEKPLTPAEIPSPVFDDLVASPYLSPQLTFPLLSSRGCYWGHCEFCHHGMVYGEKYAGYSTASVIDTINLQKQKHGAVFFAFNDEAIPPKIFRQLGQEMDTEDTQFFTGLMKFEKYYTAEDFRRGNAIGFRSLYVGLESASERVLELMRKNTPRPVMVGNLRDAAAAGIWMHCFLFFGFPGETEAEAQETTDFILSHAEDIGSYGAGTFSLEHNAPIMNKLDRFGLELVQGPADEIDVYYDYSIDRGNSREDAQRHLDALNAKAFENPKYQSTNWIPREHLLILLALFDSVELARYCTELSGTRDIQVFTRFADEMSWQAHHDASGPSLRVINRLNRSVVSLNGASAELVRIFAESDAPPAQLYRLAPWIAEGLSSASAVRVSMHDTDKVI
jgi:anaerobic magnesium-protoporphyrin IX monomethyl ester cyclase